MNKVNIIGAGLAGVEAAWYLANNSIKVKLYEQRPKKKTDAHKTDKFAELVCSNSFRSNDLSNACGVLKNEMHKLNSIVIKSALENEVSAGSALAVDREGFSNTITNLINYHPNIEVINEEYVKINEDEVTIICSGPLTSENLSKEIINFLGHDYFHFYDAAAPIVNKNSVDMSKVYLKSRYDKGEAAYLNCPMTKEEYNIFYTELINAECVEVKDFETNIFEGCMPVEVMAKRGIQTLLFGPMKPVGLETRDGKTPYAVVQLRQDNAAATLYNLVGFQTHLKWSEQKRILNLIPGLENVEIERYGVMHKNSYINSPTSINQYMQSLRSDNIFFAGQITGVEGYVESAASGINAAINVKRFIENQKMICFPKTTAMGALSFYVANASKVNFQPMNVTFGLMDPLGIKVKKRERKELMSKRALMEMDKFINDNKLL